MRKTITLHVHHAFFVHFFDVLAQIDSNWPNFKFTWGRERPGDKFYHLCLNCGAVDSLLLTNRSTWDNREIVWKDIKSIFMDVAVFES